MSPSDAIIFSSFSTSHSNTQGRCSRLLELMPPVNLPTVSLEFFHNLNIPIHSSDSSPHFVFFDRSLNLAPYKLLERDFTPKPNPPTPGQVESVLKPLDKAEVPSHSLPAEPDPDRIKKTKPRKSAKMPKEALEHIDKNFASIKNIKVAATLGDKAFNFLSEAAQGFVDEHKDACGTTPRQFKLPNWKNLTNEFIESWPVVKKSFSRQRHDFKPESDRSWPEDRVDVSFLMFALIKYHSIKRLNPKKRKDGPGDDDAEDDQATSPTASAKKKSSVSAADAASPSLRISDKAGKPGANGAKEHDMEAMTGSIAKNADETVATSVEFSESVENDGDIRNDQDDSIAPDEGMPDITAITTSSKCNGEDIQMKNSAESNNAEVEPIIKEKPVAEANGTATKRKVVPAGLAFTVGDPATIEVGPQIAMKIPFRVYINGEEATFLKLNMVGKVPFSRFLGTVLFSARDPNKRESIAGASRCRIGKSKAGEEAVWNIDLHSGEHEREWLHCMRSISLPYEGEELYVDFLKSSH